MHNIFCIECQRAPFNFYKKYLTHTLKDTINAKLKFLAVLDLWAHKYFWNCPKELVVSLHFGDTLNSLRKMTRQPRPRLTGTNQWTPNLKNHIYKNITSNIPSFVNLTLPFRNYQMEKWIIRIQVPSAQICNNWTWHFDGLWLQELLHLLYTYDVLVSNFGNNTTRHHHQTLGCGIAFSRKITAKYIWFCHIQQRVLKISLGNIACIVFHQKLRTCQQWYK